MMTKKNNLVSFPCRMPVGMLRGIDSLAAYREGTASRQQIIQNMVNQYIAKPVCLEPIDNIELREPLATSITISISKTTWEWLDAFSRERGISMSAQMRNVILCGLRQEGGK